MPARIISIVALGLAAPLVSAGEAAAATGLGDVDWVQAAAAFSVGWAALAIVLYLLARRSRRQRGGFLSWQAQLDRKRAGRAWRDRHAA